MSSLNKEALSEAVQEALDSLGFEAPGSIVLQKIPFSGMWGWATPVCFQLASLERKAGRPANVNEIAGRLRDRLAAAGRFSRVEAVKGYVNVYFDTGEVANQLLRRVFEDGPDFGRGAGKGERVMIEYSQPNTHKAFHVGHLRNVCLGHSLANILGFAGFDTLTANYPGDIGLHVMKCLWCYLKYHQGLEPDEGKGRWLGQIYTQADTLLREGDEYRVRVVDFLFRLIGPGGAAAAFRKAAAERFFAEAHRGLLEKSGDAEFGKDLLTLLQRSWLGEPLEFNEFSHRALGTWMWEVWKGTEPWLERALEESRDEDARRAELTALLQECRAIGLDEDAWSRSREVRELFGRWEKQDPELVELWERTRQWSLDDFNRIYRQLGAHFDVWFYEHEVEGEGKRIVEELIAKGVATDLRPNGPVLVDIDRKLGCDKPNFRTIVILRSDGTSLYSTKDLALAKQKFEQYKVDRSIYVVDVGQALYFQQIFKVLELWGFEQAKKCFHLAYEIVRLPSGKMSSREGSVVLYDDFFAEALRRARDSVDSKRSQEQYSELPSLDESQRAEVARAVALGAMKFGMISVDNNKPINFDFDAALSFEGQTAPYIQYAHARACRILEKAGGCEAEKLDYSQVSPETAEVNLLELIDSFAAEVDRAAREYKPLFVAVYLFNLAKSFNDFYRDCPVLKADPAVRQARLALVAATRQVLANGLALLAIPAPNYM